MSEAPSSNPPRPPGRGAGQADRARDPARAAEAPGQPLHGGEDPVTDWLLEQPHLDGTAFAVLFAIHKFNARRRGAAWIRRIDLCRSTGLDQPSLTRVLNNLRHEGLVGMSRHPVDSGRARYLLIIRDAHAMHNGTMAEPPTEIQRGPIP